MSTEFDALDPSHCVSNNLQKTARAVSRVYADEMRPCGLTRGQFPILGVLEASGPLSTTELANRLYLERTTLTRNLRPLETAGLIERPVDGTDARVRRVAITPAGRRKLREARRLWRRAQARVVDLIGTESWHALETALRDLRHAVQ